VDILIIDGQGGKLGSQLVKAIRNQFPEQELTAIGTNEAATYAMAKAGALRTASGENPVIVSCKKADVIIGPIGIIIAGALLGEVSSRMAEAIGKSQAVRLLLPMNRCENIVIGSKNLSINELVSETIDALSELMKG
jgi:hypothetical protein